MDFLKKMLSEVYKKMKYQKLHRLYIFYSPNSLTFHCTMNLLYYQHFGIDSNYTVKVIDLNLKYFLYKMNIPGIV